MSQPAKKPSPIEITHEDPERPTYAEDGTDLSLIRWMLAKTPLERLELLQSHANATLTAWRELGKR